ncbi:hypothetical protein Tco_0714863 [Tanacetum coccineum]
MKSRWRFLFLHDGHLDSIFSADDYELNIVSENLFAQQEFTPPLEQVSSRYEALAADIEDVGASRNVRRHLLGSQSSMPINANVLSGTAELRLGPANTI